MQERQALVSSLSLKAKADFLRVMEIHPRSAKKTLQTGEAEIITVALIVSSQVPAIRAHQANGAVLAGLAAISAVYSRSVHNSQKAPQKSEFRHKMEHTKFCFPHRVEKAQTNGADEWRSARGGRCVARP